ncbi:hypothetical protein BJY00DRAFT_63680 [Aspergillus carlsbadensis]|nr:hypothetical protein BJY00DRAFT_63680 [Aspergillus carlsbadensis]
MSRYPQRYGAFSRGVLAPGAPRTLDPMAPADLANQLRHKVRVSCILAPDGIIWNRYKNKTVVIIRFQLRPIEPPGYKMRSFELDISFAPVSHANSSSVSGGTSADTANSESSYPSVWLLQNPFPNPLPEYIEGRPWSETHSQGFTVEPSVQVGAGGGNLGSLFRTTEKSIIHKWQFRSYAIADEHNRPTTAKWVWESNKSNRQVESRGALHAAVALHSSRTDGLLLQCKVEGRLCNGWWWERFRTKRSEPAIWLAELGPPSNDFENHFKNLEARIKKMNMVESPREREPV